MMQHEMESQIHFLEQLAYSSVLRAFKAQSDALSWEKEGLITELRKELRVSDDEHRELLSKVNTDDVIIRIREWRTSGGTRSAMINIPQIHDPSPLSPTVSASRKRQKTSVPLSLPTQSFPGLGGGIQTPKPSPRYPLIRTPRGIVTNHASAVVPYANEASDLGAKDQLIGRRLRTRWPDDNNFYEAVIVDYNPVQGRHALVYNKGTPQESFEWVGLKGIPPEDIQWLGEEPGYHQVSHGGPHGYSNQVSHGAGRGRGNSKEQSRQSHPPPLLQNGDHMKASDEIEILHTDTLIKEVEKVFDATHPDLLEIEKAKKMLREHERALIDVIAKLADASDSDSGGDQRFMHGQTMDGEVGPRSLVSYGNNQYGTGMGMRGNITATDNQAEEYVDIL